MAYFHKAKTTLGSGGHFLNNGIPRNLEEGIPLQLRPGHTALGVRAVIPVADPQRRVAELGFIIPSGSEGSGIASRFQRDWHPESRRWDFSVDGAGRCTPPARRERCFYLLALLPPGRGCPAETELTTLAPEPGHAGGHHPEAPSPLMGEGWGEGE